MIWDIIGWALTAIGGLAVIALIVFVVLLIVISNSTDNPFR